MFPHQQPWPPVQQQETWEPPDQRGAARAGEVLWWWPALGGAQRGWGSALLGWEPCGQHSWGVTTATTTREAVQRDRCSWAHVFYLPSLPITNMGCLQWPACSHTALFKSSSSWTLMLLWDFACLLLMPIAYPKPKCFLAGLWIDYLCRTYIQFTHPFHKPLCHPASRNRFCSGSSSCVFLLFVSFCWWCSPFSILFPVLWRKGPLAAFLPRRSDLMRSNKCRRALNQSWFNQLYRWHLETTGSPILIVLIIRCS